MQQAGDATTRRQPGWVAKIVAAQALFVIALGLLWATGLLRVWEAGKAYDAAVAAGVHEQICDRAVAVQDAWARAGWNSKAGEWEKKAQYDCWAADLERRAM